MKEEREQCKYKAVSAPAFTSEQRRYTVPYDPPPAGHGTGEACIQCYGDACNRKNLALQLRSQKPPHGAQYHLLGFRKIIFRAGSQQQKAAQHFSFAKQGQQSGGRAGRTFYSLGEQTTRCGHKEASFLHNMHQLAG